MENSITLNESKNNEEVARPTADSVSLKTTSSYVSLDVTDTNIKNAVSISANVCPVQSNENTSVAKSFSSFTSDTIVPSTFKSADPKTHPDQSVLQPVIIGNISAANLLTSAVMNKQERSQLSSLSLTPVLSGPFTNIMPLVIHQLVSNPQISKNSASSTKLIPPGCNTNQFYDMDIKRAYQLQNKSLDESANVSLTSLESELCCRVPLCSSDTVILNTSSVTTSNILPLSSLICNNSSETIRTKEKSPVSFSSRPFSLLTNISDRSVSLESIPSISLFQSDHRSLYKSDSLEIIADTNKTTPEPMVSDITSNPPSSSKMSVIGSNKIPQSIIFLVKHLNQMVSHSPCDKQSCLITSSEQSKDNSSTLHNIPHQVINNQNYISSPSTKRQTDVEDERHSDTDTDMQPEEALLTNQKNTNLSRSDTVILDISKNHSDVCSGSHVHSSDTLVLACDDDNEVHSNERLSKGFSFTSTKSTPPPSLEEHLNQPSVDKHVSIEIMNNSLISQQPIPFSISALQNCHLNPSLYVVTNDGHLAAVKYISSETLDVSQLSQLGFMNNTDSFAPVLPLSSSDTSSRSVEAETQTELVFGTNTLCFKLADAVHDVNIYSVDQLSSTVLTKSLPVPQSSIPSTVIVGGNGLPSDQPQPLLEKCQKTVISLAEPIVDENAVSCSMQRLPPGTEYGITPLHTSEPELPDVSAKEECALFQCLKCKEKFKTKQTLIRHEKVHRKEFQCDLCNAAFTRVGNFNRHRKIHNLQPENQSTFKCNDCGREFLQRCDLKRHLLIHTKQEPHRCEQCGKGYIRRSDLVVHMRFHNKDKAFKCSMCDKKFFQTGDLGRHVRHAHTPNSQLTCGHCNRKYACESTMIRHMKAVHKDIILRTVNQKLQESGSSGEGPSVNNKDVLFTMTKSPEGKH